MVTFVLLGLMTKYVLNTKLELSPSISALLLVKVPQGETATRHKNSTTSFVVPLIFNNHIPWRNWTGKDYH